MSRLGIAYKATNLVNGKAYIGITTQTMCGRFTRHLQTNRPFLPLFSRAIQKYGIESFEWEVLATSYDRDELVTLEHEFIAAHNTFAGTGWGYNNNTGGAGTHGMVKSKETRRRISEAMRASCLRRGLTLRDS